MPGADGTGPAGRGPMTGRGAGFCAGYAVPGFSDPKYGQGGASRGHGGRGRRNRFFATGVPGWRSFAGGPNRAEDSLFTQQETPQNELEVLKGQAQNLENALKALQVRMDALASRNKTE